MRHLRRSAFLRLVVLPFTLTLFLSACHKWVPLEPPTAQGVAEEELGTVRVTLTDGNKVVFKEPRVRGDSLVESNESVAVPLEEVRLMEVQRTDTVATVFAIAGVVIVAGVLTFIAVCSGDNDCFSSAFGGGGSGGMF